MRASVQTDRQAGGPSRRLRRPWACEGRGGARGWGRRFWAPRRDPRPERCGRRAAVDPAQSRLAASSVSDASGNAYPLTLGSMVLLGESPGDIVRQHRVIAFGAAVSTRPRCSVRSRLRSRCRSPFARSNGSPAPLTRSSVAVIVATFLNNQRGPAIGSCRASLAWFGAATRGPLAHSTADRRIHPAAALPRGRQPQLSATPGVGLADSLE